MSYEGYTQYLCPNGHYWVEGAEYALDPSVGVCPHCKQKANWSNGVDDTNGDMYGHIEMAELTPSERHTCTCGNIHEVKPATYKPSMTREEWLLAHEKKIFSDLDDG